MHIQYFKNGLISCHQQSHDYTQQDISQWHNTHANDYISSPPKYFNVYELKWDRPQTGRAEHFWTIQKWKRKQKSLTKYKFT